MRNGSGHYAFIATLGLSALLAPLSVLAQSADDTVHELDIRRGERAVELKAGTVDPRAGSQESAAFLGIQYGVHDAWETQLGGAYRREPGNGLRFDSLEWQNKFKFLELPSLPVDVGLLAEVDIHRDRDEGYSFTFGPLLQKEIGDLQLNFNLLFERHLDENPSQPTEMGYQLQAKYRLKDGLQVGMQGFGDMGEWDDWAPRSEQSHRFGPAVFGEFSLGTSQKFEYDAAYLTDPSSSARSHGVRLRLKYRY
jgi:hypothetical protein